MQTQKPSKLAAFVREQDRIDAEAECREAAACQFVDRLTTIACAIILLAVVALIVSFFRP